jgi:hypothetical protein
MGGKNVRGILQAGTESIKSASNIQIIIGSVLLTISKTWRWWHYRTLRADKRTIPELPGSIFISPPANTIPWPSFTEEIMRIH